MFVHNMIITYVNKYNNIYLTQCVISDCFCGMILNTVFPLARLFVGRFIFGCKEDASLTCDVYFYCFVFISVFLTLKSL